MVEEDIHYLFELEKDPEVRKFTSSGVKTYEQTQETLNKCINDYQEKGLPSFLLFDLKSDECIGSVSFFLWDTGDIEVGYSLHKKFWGQSYATEALVVLLEWARKNIDADYITAYSVANNVASLRVLEKSGMTYFKSEIKNGVEGRFYRIKNK